MPRLLTRFAPLLALIALVAGCSSTPTKRGGYYQDDGPLPNPPSDLQNTPDPIPSVEPLRPANARPYTVLGRDYTPMTKFAPYKERGLASWYGRKFHGSPTASGETYDMYQMTAAHKTLPIPSYARVTNLRNGRSVIVRVNDRGPFHDGRVIDLSYAAAVRLDKLQAGTVEVEVELLQPDEIAQLQRSMRNGTPAPTLVAASGDANASAGAAIRTDGPDLNDGLYVQVGAFSQRMNAEALRARLERELTDWPRRSEIVLRGTVYRVLVGPFDDPGAAAVARDRLADLLDSEALIVDRR